MPDLGDRLREARERRGVSLRKIADTTKISVVALEALERNDPSRLPGGIFARSFVRSYAAEVGLDPDATLRQFLAEFDLEPPPALPEAESMASVRLKELGRIFLRVLVATLVLAGIILYLTRGSDADVATAPRVEQIPSAAPGARPDTEP